MSLAAFSEAGRQLLRRTIPFDYRFRFVLNPGQFSDNRLTDKVLTQTVTVSVEAPFTAVSIGYGATAEVEKITFGPSQQQDIETVQAPVLTAMHAAPLRSRVARVSLPERSILGADGPNTPIEELPPRQFLFGDLVRSLARKLKETDTFLQHVIGPRTAAVLANGIRLNPDVAKKLFINGGQNPLETDDLDNLFETTLPPKRIQFLYALFDEATGRAFQSEPILNIAGLGIADGDRPFRLFVPPITFTPQSTIRLELVPKSEFKGELHIVLHGYKVLGGADTPTGRAQGRMRRLRRP